jgi:DNA-binding GntR family transcriptional regulator
MMLVCLNRSSTTHDAVVKSGLYGISILTAEQGHLARQFGRKGGDKFEGVDYRISEHGVPLLDGALATIVCSVAETAVGGTHTIFIGRVVEADAAGGEPLAYYRGTFGRLERGQEKAAYTATRDWVLRRRTPLGEVLDAADIGNALGIDPVLVHTALIALTGEGLVKRADDGTIRPTPITPAFVDSLYDARAAIESGVVEAYLGSADAEDRAELRALGVRLRAGRVETLEELDDFLALNLAYHARLIDLAGSKQLTDNYRHLNVATVWRQTFDAEDWAAQVGNGLLGELIDAVDRGDVDAAKEALRAHTMFVKEGAKAVVTEKGGVV